MKDIRRLRLEAFIRRSVEGQLIMMDDPDLRLLTVTHIELSNDTRLAKVFVSSLSNDESHQKALMAALVEGIGQVPAEAGRRCLDALHTPAFVSLRSRVREGHAGRRTAHRTREEREEGSRGFMRGAGLDVIASRIRDAGDVFLFTHEFADGDALGSMVATHAVSASHGKERPCVCPGQDPERLPVSGHG